MTHEIIFVPKYVPGSVVSIIHTLVEYLISLFDDLHLNDITTTVLAPTWSNGRCGGGGITKRLGRFFMEDGLCEENCKYHSCSLATGF